MVLQPQRVETATWSHWDLTINVQTPLDYNQDCYIKWYLPNELKYDVKSMIASGIFLGKDSNGQLLTQLAKKTTIVPASQNPNGKVSISFSGCQDKRKMGAAPTGRLAIDDVRTQAMLKDSDTFEFFIYKDKEMTQLMAQLEKGVSLLASQMRPAVL